MKVEIPNSLTQALATRCVALGGVAMSAKALAAVVQAAPEAGSIVDAGPFAFSTLLRLVRRAMDSADWRVAWSDEATTGAELLARWGAVAAVISHGDTAEARENMPSYLEAYDWLALDLPGDDKLDQATARARDLVTDAARNLAPAWSAGWVEGWAMVSLSPLVGLAPVRMVEDQDTPLPVRGYAVDLDVAAAAPIELRHAAVDGIVDGALARVRGLVRDVTHETTRTGKAWATATVAGYECQVFPGVFPAAASLLTEGAPVSVEGRLDLRTDVPRLVVHTIDSAPDAPIDLWPNDGGAPDLWPGAVDVTGLVDVYDPPAASF